MARFFDFVVFIICLGFTNSNKLPSYINYCHRNDPQIYDCFRKAIDALKVHLPTGIPEFQLPPMNPLVIPLAELNSGSNFKAVFKNIEIYQTEIFNLNKLVFDFDKNHVEIVIDFPKLRIKSQYDINGKILVLQLRGKGQSDGNFTDVSGTLLLDGYRYMKHGKEYVDFNKKKVLLKVGKPTLEFGDIFGDNTDLNIQTNRIINENIEDIIKELMPVIEQVASDFVFGLVGRVFSRFSLDELFPK